MTWDEYFLKIAEVVALKSKDVNTRVGAVIVDQDNRILSTGFNGLIAGMPDTETNWTKPAAYGWICHAEENAVAYARAPLKGCTIYTSLSPCGVCMKLILQAGITRIVTSKYRKDPVSEFLSEQMGVKIEVI